MNRLYSKYQLKVRIPYYLIFHYLLFHNLQVRKKMKENVNFESEVYEPLDALCTNKERNKVAIAGRTVTKIFSIHENYFELQTDRNKPRKTMYFSGSIAWSPLKDNLIAVTSSNGTIYTWDPESLQTMEISYRAHKQLATKVCFSEFNENLLASGSKDSTIWLYDLRSAQPTTCFASNQDDSIRDIQFCMESKLQDTFVSAGDSGIIRFWDIRRPDKPIKEFIAHNSQVYSIALNPQIQSKNLIATAGRDKYIRIWDWSKNTPQFLYTVEMMAIVTRVSWCPDNSWHVACCFAPPSGFVSSDNTIYVWDIRRPFIPYASFDAHTKTCTDMSWPHYSGNSFLSCGKDGKLIMNFIENAHRPILYANSVAITTNSSSHDELIVSVPTFRRKTSSSTALLDTSDPFRRKVPSTIFNALPTDPFLLDSKTIAYFGQKYKINGKLISELCEYNAIIAENILKNRCAYVWRMIAEIIVNSKIDVLRPKFTSNCLKNYESIVYKHNEIHRDNKNDIGDDGKRKKGNENEFEPAPTAMLISGGSLTVHNPFSANMDLFFGTDELNLGGMENDSDKIICTSKRSVIFSPGFMNLSQLNEEAFDLNKRISQKNSMNLKRIKLNSKMDCDGINFDENLVEDELIYQQNINKLEIKSASSNSTENQEEFEENEIENGKTTSKCPSEKSNMQQQYSIIFDSLPSLRSLLGFLSNLGDLQMCSTVCLVLGEKIIDYKLVNPDQLDLWFYMYIELLERLKLWRISSLMIKTCFRPKINQLSNESTFVKVFCQNCRKLSTRASLRCSKCRELYNYNCSLCETIVRGIWTSCSECGHGGHIFHMEEWFNQFQICPAFGCGHRCNGNIKNTHISNP